VATMDDTLLKKLAATYLAHHGEVYIVDVYLTYGWTYSANLLAPCRGKLTCFRIHVVANHEQRHQNA
jgi:hypothetical protein